MNYLNIFFKILIICYCIKITVEATPTQRHLELHSFEKINENLKPKMQEKVPQFLEIANQEDEETFFGYHGMSQNNRLFQDILKGVFEEVLEIPMRDDFYFLRIPGESTWDWKNGKHTFLTHFEKSSIPSQQHKNFIVKNFLLTIGKGLGISLKLNNFNAQEKSMIWNFFQSNINDRIQRDWVKKAKSYCMPTHYKLRKAIENKNLKNIIKIVTQKISRIDPKIDAKKIKGWFKENFNSSFDTELIFFLRELGTEKSCHVLQLANLDIPFDDTTSPQNSILVSLNTSIFGNYVDEGCFTAGIFLDNESVLGGDEYLEEKLKVFFENIGLEPSLASLIWKEGQEILVENNENKGCLLQFFDKSVDEAKKAFSMVDQNTYISFRHGVPVTDLVPSNYIQGLYKLKKNRKDLELRIVVNNQTILNPFSPLKLVRYNGNFERLQNVTRVTELIKQRLKNISKDEVKLQNYLEQLENLWNISLKK